VREIRRTVRQGLWVAVAASIPAMALLAAGEPLLVLLRQNPALAAEAGLYLRALLWALLPSLAFLVLRLFIASIGRPGWGLAIALLGVPVNGGLAALLISGGFGIPPLGLVGAGIATTATTLLGLVALCLVLAFDRGFRRFHIFGRFWRPDWPRFRRVWRLGLPIGATLALEVGLFNGSGLLMGALGTTELAAHAIALQIAALCFMVPLGLGQAATIRVGQAFGAGEREGVGRAGWIAFGLAVAFMSSTALILFVAPGPLVAAFIDTAAHPEVAGLAVMLLALAALFQIADGAQTVGAGMLRGLQDTRIPMIYAALGYWGVGAPLGFALAFPLGFRGPGVWTGLAAGLAVVSALMLWRWSRRDRLGLTRRAGD
jgi:MATE family multidrug resistance protein